MTLAMESREEHSLRFLLHLDAKVDFDSDIFTVFLLAYFQARHLVLIKSQDCQGGKSFFANLKIKFYFLSNLSMK